MLIQVDKPDDYFSQRNNLIKPMSACNVTSFSCFLQISGWLSRLPIPAGTQPEDWLMNFFQSQEAKDKLHQVDPSGEIGTDQPNEVHAVLCWGINLLLQRYAGAQGDVVKFGTQWNAAQDFVASLQDNRPVVLSGRYPCYSARANDIITIGHVTCLVGVELDDNTNQPIRWIVDDPYGDVHTNYQNDSGRDISLTAAEFTKWVQSVGSPNQKWGHMCLQKGF
jgi:hypothetical protein